MLVVDLFEQIFNIALDALLVHRRQDRLDRFCLREPIELMAPVHACQLKDQCEPERRVVLDDCLDVICLSYTKHEVFKL